MRTFFLNILIILLIFSFRTAAAQTGSRLSADSLFKVNGEVYFKFRVNEKSRVDSISGIISIDNYKDGEVYAYANRNEFDRFLTLHIDYVLLPAPISLLSAEELNMGNLQKNSLNMTVWNFYPTYSQYVTFMTGFAAAYPAICKLDTIGTTPRGHLLLALKISDSVNYDRGVPQFLYTSSIHGDELTGYVMMLHLIDTLLNSYGTSTRITNLIHNTQIFINPLANPDGTYRGGDNTVGGAIRGNANNIDMNRNYPDPRTGQHPDGYIWQPETMAFMDYADRHHFRLSMNFHGGAEVVNYPWDTWAPPHITADDSWWQYVSHEYADTAQHFGPAGYFTDVTSTGVTNGAAWYVITGGRQDCHNFFKHDREVTVEISETKTPAASALPSYWSYNYRSFFHFIEQAGFGINGKVYDSVTYAPIAAKVYVNSHDADSSWIYSFLPAGWYFRMIDNGSWSITFSAPGYYSRTYTGLTVPHRTVNRLNVKLRPIDIYWPRSFTATAVSGNEIDLSWLKNADNNPVMIAFNITPTFGTPAGGTSYAPGSAISGGGYVLYNGTNTSFYHTGLDPNTTYYYRAWSVRAGNTYSAPALATATTFCGVSNAFPLSESFGTATVQLPNCWTQEITGPAGTYPVFNWIRNNSANAGGTAWEMRVARQAGISPGTTRLKTYFFNTTGITVLNLSFRHFLDARATGATLKIQSSSDGVTWTDEWAVATTASNITAITVNVNITHNLNSPTTMIAFVVTGNLGSIDYWYIDDVSMKAPGYWVGGTIASPNDWNTGTNWGDGLVPVAATNVYIPPRTFLPVITNDPATPAQCNDMVISRNAGITVASGKKIIVNGNLTLQAP